MTRLRRMQGADPLVDCRSRQHLRMVLGQVLPDALLATGYPQQIAIALYTPVPVQTGLGECLVEGHPVAITFGIRQGAVDIEDQCTKFLHIPLSRERS